VKWNLRRKLREGKRRKLEEKKRRIERRLQSARKLGDSGRPVLAGNNITYELSDRVQAIAHGGIGAVHRVAQLSGLPGRIDDSLKVLKQHQPYHESDHVLNIAYNAICGGQTLDDIETRRNDEVFLEALGTTAIPDPTTAGDFCRRFSVADIEALQDAINETRIEVWKRQGPEFFAQRARIDADGSLVPTTGECKEGMGLSHKGVWGYHPLIISLANTQEPLFLANRSGNRPSHEGAVAYYDRAIALCRRAGFKDILLRGDTDFSLTAAFDSWTQAGVRFVFGYDVKRNLKALADALNGDEYARLVRRAEEAFDDKKKRRAKPARVKEQIVHEKGYKNIRLRSEDVAEFPYRPSKCTETYRMIVLRKNLTIERGEQALIEDIRYFFYITNDPKLSAEQVVAEANHRCDQENLISQLKNGVRALHAPVNTLHANWAYMVMAALAWSLKAWLALWLPIDPRWREKHRRERDHWLRMDFRSFRSAIIDVPAQILHSGRQLIYRFLAWRPQLPVFFRLLDAL